jgi:hypothetical protein
MKILKIKPFKSSFKGICDRYLDGKLCKNKIWENSSILINPVIVGGLIISFEICFEIECSKCRMQVNDFIGYFDENLRPTMLNNTIDKNKIQKKTYLMKSLKINDKIIEALKEIKKGRN